MKDTGRVFCAGAVLMLCACTIVPRSQVIGLQAPDRADAVLLVTPEDDTFWVQPLQEGPHSPVPSPVPIPHAGLWVTAGRLMVRFLCYSPKDGLPASDAYPIIRNTRDQRAIDVKAGHRYRLACSDKRIGVFRLVDMSQGQAGP